MAPLERADLEASPRAGLFLTGDVARVVEPFTGEGIYYALKSGMLAGQAAVMELSGNPVGGWYAREHAGMYRRRFWVNRLARVAVTRPWVGSLVIRAGAAFPGLLRWVTSKVVRPLSAPGG
jgi:flavin-dependent dehydrogenase